MFIATPYRGLHTPRGNSRATVQDPRRPQASINDSGVEDLGEEAGVEGMGSGLRILDGGDGSATGRRLLRILRPQRRNPRQALLPFMHLSLRQPAMSLRAPQVQISQTLYRRAIRPVILIRDLRVLQGTGQVSVEQIADRAEAAKLSMSLISFDRHDAHN